MEKKIVDNFIFYPLFIRKTSARCPQNSLKNPQGDAVRTWWALRHTENCILILKIAKRHNCSHSHGAFVVALHQNPRKCEGKWHKA